MHQWMFVLALLLPVVSFAADEDVSPAVVARTQSAIPDLKVDAVHDSPVAGIYELQAGGQLFYADADGSHLIAGGHIFETATHKDLTKARLEDINRIDWSVLPLDKAIVSGDVNGKLKVAVFTDPECPYCKKLEEELKNIHGVRGYTFLFPLISIHPGSYARAEGIWCSKHQHETLLKVMLANAATPAAGCATPLDEIQSLAGKLGISGTPTMIAGDGRISSGVKASDALKKWLENR